MAETFFRGPEAGGSPWLPEAHFTSDLKLMERDDEFGPTGSKTRPVSRFTHLELCGSSPEAPASFRKEVMGDES